MPGGEKGGKEGKFGGGNGVEEGLTRGAGGATMTGMAFIVPCARTSLDEEEEV